MRRVVSNPVSLSLRLGSEGAGGARGAPCAQGGKGARRSMLMRRQQSAGPIRPRHSDGRLGGHRRWYLGKDAGESPSNNRSLDRFGNVGWRVSFEIDENVFIRTHLVGLHETPR